MAAPHVLFFSVIMDLPVALLFSWLVAAIGALLFASRLLPRRAPVPPCLSAWPRVSVVVPARNEEANLPALLISLNQVDYPDLQVIVVDDQSQDRTAEIARGFRCQVVQGQPRPEGWAGKAWACHQGQQVATGSFLLFTDADTRHTRHGLRNLVAFAEQQRADLVSCLPYHLCSTWWEKLLGPFHLMLLAVTRAYGTPRPGKLFAIGQYLLFKADSYRALGGHEAVRALAIEDLPLANLCVSSGQRYCVWWGSPAFHVRMYASLGDLIRGWRRNFHFGLKTGRPMAFVEVVLMFAALGSFNLSVGHVPVLPVVLALFMAWRQRQMGSFSVWGALLHPLPLGLYVVVTALALGDILLRRDLAWKGRVYRV